jgi:hypothetical protein
MATEEQLAAFQTAVASGNIQEAANIAASAGYSPQQVAEYVNANAPILGLGPETGFSGVTAANLNPYFVPTPVSGPPSPAVSPVVANPISLTSAGTASLGQPTNASSPVNVFSPADYGPPSPIFDPAPAPVDPNVDEFNSLIREGKFGEAGVLATGLGFTPEQIQSYLNDTNVFPEFGGGVTLETVQSIVSPPPPPVVSDSPPVINQTSAPTTPPAYDIRDLFLEFLGREPNPEDLDNAQLLYGDKLDTPDEINDFITKSKQEILNRQSFPVNSLFEGGKQPSLEELRRVQNDPLTQALNSYDQYLLAGQYPEAKALLDSTIATYGLNPTESYANMATYLNTNPKFEDVRKVAGNKLFTGENIANFGKPLPPAPVGPAGGIYQRTPQEQAAYASQLASIPVNTAVPLPVMPMSIGPSAALTRARQPGAIGEEEYYGAIRNVISSGDYTPAQLRQMQQQIGTSGQDINVAFGRGMTPISATAPTLPGATAGTTQSIDQFIQSRAPTTSVAMPTSPSMFSPENVRAQLELERLRLQPTPEPPPEEPVAGFAQGGLVSDDINRMLQNQRNAIQRESQSRQMLTNLGAPPVKKFSDGGPAGSSSGVRRLEMSGYQGGGEVNENPYVRMAREERAAQDKAFDSVNRQLSDLLERYKEGDEGITEKDLLPFFPGYNEYDIAQMYGTTTESSVPSMSSKARSFTPEIMSNLRKHDELMQKDFDRLVKEKRLPRDVITARTLGLANGGEVTNDEFIQQVMTGTPMSDTSTRPGILPPELREAIDVPLDFANLLIRGTAAVPIGGVAGLYKGLTGGKYGTQEGVKEADTEAARMMAKITGEPKTQAAKDVLQSIGDTMQKYKLDAAMPQLLTLPSPGPGAASALMRSYELAETPPSGVVKMPGGNWLEGQVEHFVRSLKKDIPWTQSQLEEMPGVAKAEAPNLALNKFIETGLTRYIKNDMASAKDTLRNLADENTIKAGKAYNNDLRQVKKAYDRAEKIKAEGPRPNMLPGTWENAIEAQLGRARQLEEEANRKLNLELRHALPFPVLQEDGELAGGLNFHIRRNLQTGGKETLVSSRKEAGQAEEGVAQTPTGKVWETMADLFVKPQAAGQITDQDYFMRSTDSQRVLRNNPWLATVPPETPVYIPQDVFRSSSFLNSFSADDLGFKHITDELANAMNPESGLPANLLLTPDEVANMGMEKAARHVIEVNKWREEQMGVANALRAQKSISLYKDYPTIPGKTEPNQRGLQWLELKLMPEDDTPESMVKAKEALADALKYEGEVMGHCVGGECPKVESGKSRIISLRDAKGEPHVTLEVIPPEVNFSDVLGGNPAFPNRDPELYRMMDTMTTTQIEKTPLYKEKAAAIAAQKLPGISQIKGKGNNRPPDSYQPFITDFIASQQWSSVGDLQNTNLVRIEPMILKNAQDRGFNPQIVTTIKERPYITKEEFNRLADLFGGMNKYAAGGEVTDFIKRAA